MLGCETIDESAAGAVQHSFYYGLTLTFEVACRASLCSCLQTKLGQGSFEAMRPIGCMGNRRVFLTCGFRPLSRPMPCSKPSDWFSQRRNGWTSKCMDLDTAQNTKKIEH